MQDQDQQLEALHDIRRMMKRSSKFLSLSGLSGMAAGFWALAGSYIAYLWIIKYHNQYGAQESTGAAFQNLKWNLLLLAAAVLGVALLSALYFTWRRANKNSLPVWDHTSRLLIINILIPLVTGGLLIMAFLQHNDWRFVAPLSLIFYGLALVNGSKYTLSEIRYLGFTEIILGLINTQFTGYGLYFWALGFGVLHIVYGFIMWWKYERGRQEQSGTPVSINQ
jgi:hypothetical protein